MEKKYSFLEPIKIGNVTLKNRVVLSAMIKYLCTDDGFVTDPYIAYYREMARGGTAMITPGAMVVDADWAYKFPRAPWLTDDKYIPGLKKAIDAVHEEGALFICQLWHPGQIIKKGEKQVTKTVNDFTKEEIKALQKKYVDAARRAKAAGADGIEFHCAHCYLPNQFLSPYFNQRTDEYGSDTVENSVRFSLEIIDQIRDELCNDDFLINAKINGSDFVEGGTTPERAAAAAKLFEEHGVKMITVNGGGSLTLITGMSDDGHQPEGWKIAFAETVKKAVSIPVAGCGSLRHADYCDQIIREGKCDILAIGRGLLAEPEFVKKTSEGRTDELRYCVSCMHCFSPVMPGVSGCSVNPWAKRETEKVPLVKDGDGRKVAVIGAGAAGLEAAVTLAERGFVPVIFEKGSEIGGQIVLAAVPPFKQKLLWMVDYYNTQIKRLGIEVRLNTEATVDAIKAIDPYAVVIATGSVESIPPIEGTKGDNVVTARDVLNGKAPKVTGKKTVILGGGLTGLETALVLRSAGNDVTVLEMMPPNPNPNVETQLAQAYTYFGGVVVKTEHKVTKIDANEVTAEDLKNKTEVKFPADLVVLSLGIKPYTNPALDEISKSFSNVTHIGDCDKPGKISSAVQAGSMIGYSLK